MLDTNLLSKEEKKKQQSLHRAYVEKARSMEKSGPLPRARFQDPSVENTENEHKYHENEHPGNMTMIELHQLMMDEPELTIEMVKVFENVGSICFVDVIMPSITCSVNKYCVCPLILEDMCNFCPH